MDFVAAISALIAEQTPLTAGEIEQILEVRERIANKENPRRTELLFSPTLRFATHWAELTHPFGAVTVVSYQLLSSQLSANNSTTQQSNNPTPEGHHFLINFCVYVCPSLTTRTKYSPAGSPAIEIWNVGSFVRNERSIVIPLQSWIS